MNIVNFRSFYHWSWLIVGISFGNFVINYSIRLGYGVALPEMISDLGFDRTAGASIYNAYLLCYISLTPFAGYLTDKFGARWVITISSTILGVGALLMGTTSTLWSACLFYAIAGAGAAGIWGPVLTVVQHWFSPNRRGLALGIVGTGPGTGFGIMGVIFPWVAYHLSWRYGWYFLGIAALGMVIINGLFLRSTPEDIKCLPWGSADQVPYQSSNSLGPSHVGNHSISLLLTNKRFWLIGLSYFSITYSVYGITTFMIDYARYQLGLPYDQASLLATIHGSFSIIGVLLILPISDSLGRKRTIMIANLCIAVCVIGILLATGSSTMLFLLVGFLAAFYGAIFPMYGACAGDFFPRDIIGVVIGAWTTIYGVGAILAHWVTGLLRDYTGLYDSAFFIDSIMAGTGFLLLALIRTK
jgi:sugar phosphate permease